MTTVTEKKSPAPAAPQDQFQRQTAIHHVHGPLLMIAGPGSGKTHTLVERIVQLIRQGYPPESLMAATFTEKAAKELVTRVSNRLLRENIRANLHEMYIGTLHSIFLRIIEDNREYSRLRRNYRLLDDFDQKFFIFRNLSAYYAVENSELILGEGKTSAWDKVKNLIYYLNKVSEECLDPEVLCGAEEAEIRAIGECYKIYAQQLADENALDFSTIQTECLHLLENNPAVLDKIRDKILFFMVDEYQDTNTVQEKILLLLAGRNNNLCVVGDDDQGLYRFRGATIRNILQFEQNFPPGVCRRVTLTTNFRSHPGIVDFYNRWMQQQDWTHEGETFRFDKTIQPRESEFGQYSSVIKVSTGGLQDDYHREVLAFIRHLEQSGVLRDHNQIAFLFKSVKNDSVIALAQFLEDNDIRVFSPRSALFFEREEVQLLLGALIFVFPTLFDDLKWKEDAFLPVWERYETWKNRFAEALREDPARHADLIRWCQRRARAHIAPEKPTTYAFAALLYQLLEFPLFSRFLDVNLNGHKTDLRAAYNIAMLTRLLFKFEYLYNISVLAPKYFQKNLRDLFNTFLRFMIDGGIEEFEDYDEYAPSGCVSFMTIHQSKGLEFPITVVGSLNLVPRKQYDDIDELLERRYYHKPPFEPIHLVKNYDFWRLYYTAFSRSQNLLVLSAHEREGKGLARCPSRYFEPVYTPLPSWRDPAFDLSQVRLDDIKPVNLKHEYAFTSHILLYENCPLQYKFYKELQFTEVRTGGVLGGSLLHQTIEDIHRAVLRREEHLLTDDIIREWFDMNYFLLSKQQRSYLHQAQLESLYGQVLRYRDRNAGRWHLILEAEVDVSLVKEDFILKGTIDLIEGEGGTVELVDFKSGDKPDVNSADPLVRKRLEQYRRQLEVYAHLVEERTGQKVSRMHLYFPKEDQGNPQISFRYDPRAISQTVQSFEAVVRKIEAKDFDMNGTEKSEKLCGDCDMRFHCNPRYYSK